MSKISSRGPKIDRTLFWKGCSYLSTNTSNKAGFLRDENNISSSLFSSCFSWPRSKSIRFVIPRSFIVFKKNQKLVRPPTGLLHQTILVRWAERPALFHTPVKRKQNKILTFYRTK